MNRHEIELVTGCLETSRDRLQPRRAPRDELHALARRCLDRAKQQVKDRHHNPRDDSIKKKTLDDALHQRLAAERQKLFRHITPETRTASGSGDDDEDAIVRHV
jgi:hypothetical protein